MAVIVRKFAGFVESGLAVLLAGDGEDAAEVEEVGREVLRAVEELEVRKRTAASSTVFTMSLV